MGGAGGKLLRRRAVQFMLLGLKLERPPSRLFFRYRLSAPNAKISTGPAGQV